LPLNEFYSNTEDMRAQQFAIQALFAASLLCAGVAASDCYGTDIGDRVCCGLNADNSGVWTCPNDYSCASDHECNKNGTPVGTVVGAVIGVTVLLCVMAICFRIWRRRRAAGYIVMTNPAPFNNRQVQATPGTVVYGEPVVGVVVSQPVTAYTRQANAV
jgi:hypothetical protein